MGFWRSLFGLDAVAASQAVTTLAAGPQFAVDRYDIDPALFGLESWGDAGGATSPAPRVSRRLALQVPAVKRSRDLIAGTLGGLPLDLYGPDQAPAVSTLFTQPEAHRPRSVTMARLFEDLMLEQVAWWRVEEIGWHGYPVRVRRLDPARVNVTKGEVRYDGQPLGPRDVIRFDSPTEGLLTAGARAIRTCLHLDAAAAQHADGVPPVEYFTPSDLAGDDWTKEDVQAFLTQWRDARRAGTTGYVPAEVEYHNNSVTPRDLQLADARQHAVLEIARVAGVDPEDLGVSTTSRTYANAETRRRDLLDFTLAAFMLAVQDRLSMGDVTPRGYYARFNLDAFLRSDTKNRYDAYEVGLRVGALTRPEIRALEDRPPLTDAEAAAIPTGDTNVVPLRPAAAYSAADPHDPGPAFDHAAPAVVLDPTAGHTFAVDHEARVIRGMIVPWHVPALSRGQLWQFAPGTLTYSDAKRVKLWIQHKPESAVGHAFELTEHPDGLYGAFRVANTPEGDRALQLADPDGDAVLDAFSIGLGQGGTFRTVRGPNGPVNHAVAMPLMETSLTPAPSFDNARVHAVAASATQEGTTMPDETAVADAPATATTEPLDFSPITDAIQAGFAALTPEVTPPEQVNPALDEPVTVTEAPCYRFDGARGEHDFSTDLIAFGRDQDGEAGQRLMTFLGEAFSGPAFDVESADVTTVNPARQRPDMYVDERKYNTPVYQALYSGSITDSTPFVVPKFNSAADLVDDHVEKVEPDEGSFTVTSQTVTPTAFSGKVPITREVWDQGGNPQVSGLIWAKMVYEYQRKLESKAVAVLTANAASITDLALTNAATDDDLVNELEAHLTGLQFVAGGDLLSVALTHIDLYKRLAAAVDSTGRKLLPQYGPTNANGQARSRFKSLDVGGYEFAPAWSLGATSAASSNSWLIDPQAVHVWNSAPQRLQFEYRVAYIDLGIWGYVASAVTDAAGVRQITYDPTS